MHYDTMLPGKIRRSRGIGMVLVLVPELAAMRHTLSSQSSVPTTCLSMSPT